MKSGIRKPLIVIFLATIGLLLITLLSSSGKEPGPIIAITDVNLIPMDRERVLKNQTILIENGKIKHIGPDGKIDIPTDAKIVNGNNKYLLPGFFDMHTHFF